MDEIKRDVEFFKNRYFNEPKYLDEVQTDINYLLMDIEALESELKKANDRWRRYKEADPKCNDIQYMISVEQANERLEKENKALESQLKEKDERIEALKIHTIDIGKKLFNVINEKLEKDKKIEELESKGIGCKKVIEEFKKVNPTLEARIKELEKIVGYVKNNEIYEIRRLFDDPDKEIERLISHLDLAISAGREGWKKAKELEEGIEDILSYVVQKRLKELSKKGDNKDDKK